MLPLQISAEGYGLFGEPVSDLAEVFSVARDIQSERYDVAGQSLVFDFQRLRYGEWTLYDSQDEFITLASEELEHRKSGEPGHRNSLLALGVRPLSLVGTLLTYETTWACACGGGPPGSQVAWTSVDLSTRRVPDPIDYLEPDSLMEALLQDKCVAPLLTSSRPRPGTLEDLVALLKSDLPVSGDCSRASEAFQAFAFAGYDSENDLVTVRFGFPYEISAGHTKTSYLGIRVRPRAAFRPALAEASEGRGFFLQDSGLPAEDGTSSSGRSDQAARTR